MKRERSRRRPAVGDGSAGHRGAGAHSSPSATESGSSFGQQCRPVHRHRPVGTLSRLHDGGMFGQPVVMPYLVEVVGTWTAEGAANAMEAAFVQMAEQVFAPVERTISNRPGFDALREHLGERRVALTGWQQSNQLRVSAGEWDRGEVETNLRQIEVIILALRSEKLRSSATVKLNPTQQSGWDAEGISGEGPWVLEAFGGANVMNNGKLENDATALHKAPLGVTGYFACRPKAWRGRDANRTVKDVGRLVLVNGNYAGEGVRLLKLEPLT